MHTSIENYIYKYTRLRPITNRFKELSLCIYIYLRQAKPNENTDKINAFLMMILRVRKSKKGREFQNCGSQRTRYN